MENVDIVWWNKFIWSVYDTWTFMWEFVCSEAAVKVITGFFVTRKTYDEDAELKFYSFEKLL